MCAVWRFAGEHNGFRHSVATLRSRERVLTMNKKLFISLAPLLAIASLALTAVTAEADYVYVANNDYGFEVPAESTVSQYNTPGVGLLSPLNPPTQTAEILPTDIAVAPSNSVARYLYVTNERSNNVSQYRFRKNCTGASCGTILPKADRPVVSGGKEPEGIARATVGGKSIIYVVNEASFSGGNVSEFEVTLNGTLQSLTGAASIPAGTESSWIAVTPKSECAYVTNYAEGAPSNVSEYKIETSAPAGHLTAVVSTPTIPALKGPLGIAATNSHVYVVNIQSEEVSEYKIESGCELKNIGSIKTGKRPIMIALAHNEEYAYVTNSGAKNLEEYEIEPISGKLKTMLSGKETPVGENGPSGIAVSPTMARMAPWNTASRSTKSRGTAS
jgi:DNA-binding beta-propeller fold protein YncE